MLELEHYALPELDAWHQKADFRTIDCFDEWSRLPIRLPVSRKSKGGFSPLALLSFQCICNQQQATAFGNLCAVAL
jgi:hypothetical protein